MLFPRTFCVFGWSVRALASNARAPLYDHFSHGVAAVGNGSNWRSGNAIRRLLKNVTDVLNCAHYMYGGESKGGRYVCSDRLTYVHCEQCKFIIV